MMALLKTPLNNNSSNRLINIINKIEKLIMINIYGMAKGVHN